MDKINILLVDNNPSKLLTYEAMLAELNENITVHVAVTEYPTAE